MVKLKIHSGNSLQAIEQLFHSDSESCHCYLPTPKNPLLHRQRESAIGSEYVLVCCGI